MDLSFGLDIGSSKIKLAVADLEIEDEPKFLWGKIIDSHGMKRGNVKDRIALKNTLSQLLEEAENSVNQPVSQVLASSNFEVQSSRQRGTILVSNDRPIGGEEVQRAVSSARAGMLPANKEIIGAYPVNFNLDGVSGIDDPHGMIGTRFEAEVLIVSTASNIISNISDVVKESGWDSRRITLSSLGGAELALHKKEKELGSVLIDFGAENTTIMVFYEGKLVWVESLRVGSSAITNDLAVGLPASVEIAEEIKIKYGSAWAKDTSKKEKVKIEDEIFSKKQIAEIIEPRMEEILDLIKQVLGVLGLEKKLPGGAIFIGGGSHLSGIIKLTKHVLSLPTRIATVDKYFETKNSDNLDFCNALGLAFSREKKGKALGFLSRFIPGRLKRFIQ